MDDSEAQDRMREDGRDILSTLSKQGTKVFSASHFEGSWLQTAKRLEVGTGSVLFLKNKIVS